jgi:hypothetical protein
MQMSSPRYQSLLAEIAPVRERLLKNPLYTSVRDEERLHVFLEHHVFAVWDFMSLLKSLQRHLTCVEPVWVPRGSPAVRRFVNEIVVGEESDELGHGRVLSHYELYLEAMRAAGANTRTIESFVAAVSTGASVRSALASCGAPPASRAFVESTFAALESGSLPAIAAFFTLGREELVPDMFRRLVADLAARFPGRYSLYQLYLERHIEVDSGSHGPLSQQLLAEVCGSDERNWQLATRAAVQALEARIALWDGTLAAIESRRPAVVTR